MTERLCGFGTFLCGKDLVGHNSAKWTVKKVKPLSWNINKEARVKRCLSTTTHIAAQVTVQLMTHAMAKKLNNDDKMKVLPSVYFR